MDKQQIKCDTPTHWMEKGSLGTGSIVLENKVTSVKMYGNQHMVMPPDSLLYFKGQRSGNSMGL